MRKFVLLFWAASCYGAVVIPAPSVTNNAATGTFTITTAPQSAGGKIVVCFDAQASGLPTVTSVVGSRNGAYSLVKRATASGGYADVYAYSVANTSASAETVTITMSSSSYWMAMVSFQAQGAATSPISSTASGSLISGTGADINTGDNATGVAGDAVVSCTGNYYPVTAWVAGATNPPSMAIIGHRNEGAGHDVNLGVAAVVLGASYTGKVGNSPGAGVTDYGATAGFVIQQGVAPSLLPTRRRILN